MGNWKCGREKLVAANIVIAPEVRPLHTVYVCMCHRLINYREIVCPAEAEGNSLSLTLIKKKLAKNSSWLGANFTEGKADRNVSCPSNREKFVDTLAVTVKFV